MIPTTNNIQAILVAVPAIPVKPNNAAISAITKKISAQLNINTSLVGYVGCCRLSGLNSPKQALCRRLRKCLHDYRCEFFVEEVQSSLMSLKDIFCTSFC